MHAKKKTFVNFFLKYKQIERTKMLKYLTDKSIETIIENINLKKRLAFLNIKRSVLENYVPINTTSTSFNSIRIDCVSFLKLLKIYFTKKILNFRTKKITDEC